MLVFSALLSEGGVSMPFYEYLCGACGKDFVLLQSISAKEEDTVCPYCDQKKAKKLVSNFLQPVQVQAAASAAAIPGAGLRNVTDPP